MATRLDTYADWLVANQDKQGTAQFNTVAEAYKELRRQSQGPKQTDNALMYSVDQAQRMAGKGIEVVGDLVGSETVKDFGAGVVEQQDQDIAEGGYTPTYTGSLVDTYDEGGISAALGWIGEKSAENAASGGVAIAGTAAAAITAPFSVPAAIALTGTTLVGSAVMGAGEAALEQEERTGDYDSRVAAGVGVIIGILDKFGAGKVIPKGKLSSMTGEQIVEKLIKAGKPNAAAAIGKRIVKATAGEAVTETAQDAAIVGSTAAMGGEYTGTELRDRALESAVIGGTIGGGTRTTAETVNAAGRGVKAIVPDAGYQPQDAEAAADVAQRLQTAATDNNFDLNNVTANDTNGARAAIDTVHSQLVSDIDQAYAALKPQLREAKGDSDQVAADKAAVARARKMAKTKTKNTVGKAEMDATQRLLGNTAEGQQLMRFFRQSNELTGLHNQGLVGGLSRYTDAFSPIPSRTGYSDRALVELPTKLGLSTVAAGYTGGASIPLQLGAAAGGRVIDRITGRRSNVARFIREQQAAQGTADPTAPSVRAAAALAQQQQDEQSQQAAADRRAANRDLARQGAAPTPGSPQDTVERGTGLDRRGVADIIKIIERTSTNPAIIKSIQEYRISVDQGGTIDNDMLSPLIRQINATVDSNPQLEAKMVRPRDRGDQPQQQDEAELRRERGKQQNRQFLKDIRERVNESVGMLNVDKAILNQALTELATNLGPDPVQSAVDIVQAAEAQLTKKVLAEKYLQPYIDRIAKQQKRGKRAKVEDAPQKVQPEPEPVPTPEVPEPLQQTGMYAPIDPETYDVDQPYYHGTASAFREFDASEQGAITGVKSAKMAFWFSDDTETAQSYAAYAASSGTVLRLTTEADRLERAAQKAQKQGQKGRANDLFDQADLLRGEAEAEEARIQANPDERFTGQNIIPVYLPKNLFEVDIEGETFTSDSVRINKILEKAKAEGYAGVKFLNLDDAIGLYDRPATHIAIFNPENIRSQFAPKTRAEAKALLSMATMLGLTGLVTALQAMLGGDEEEQGVLAMPRGALTT